MISVGFSVEVKIIVGDFRQFVYDKFLKNLWLKPQNLLKVISWLKAIKICVVSCKAAYHLM